MSDIVERLRAPLPNGMCGDSMGCNAASICLCSHIEDQRELFTEAADEIASLRARVEVFGGALQLLEQAAGEVHRKGAIAGAQWPKLSGALVRARAALTQPKDTTDDA